MQPHPSAHTFYGQPAMQPISQSPSTTVHARIACEDNANMNTNNVNSGQPMNDSPTLHEWEYEQCILDVVEAFYLEGLITEQEYIEEVHA